MTYPILSTIHGPADLKRMDIGQLPDLAQEIREAICEQVSKTGGHLAPNLGVVELTIALHYVFDFGPEADADQAAGDDAASHNGNGGGRADQGEYGDRLLFDVGHQCYPHKLLTGRLPLLANLRTREGMSGFPAPRESPYDLFSVGHAGTGIPTAVGMARGDDMLAGGPGKSKRKAVALVGDASIVNGVALEGLNNAGTLQRQFLVVLNDNGMAISRPQGAMASYFDRFRVSQTYGDFKRNAKQVLDHIPGGSVLEGIYHRGSEMLKAAIATEHLFEHFGLICVGPIDGHDIRWLIEMLEEVKHINRPILLHCKTIKGKGFKFSEGDASAFHSPKPFKVEGCRVEVQSGGRSFTAAYAEAMIDLMKRDEKMFAVTAAMADGTGVAKVMSEFPDRAMDTGICESHAMDMCAGMAKSGVKPFFAVYSTFSQRALDQVFQEVALQGMPVRICMDRAGYVGGDGAVHHGFMDVSMFRVFPGAVVMAAADEPTLRHGLEFMRQYDDGASFIRYPRDTVAPEPIQSQEHSPPFELGKANLVRPAKGKKPNLAILAFGILLYQAHEAIKELAKQGYDVALYDARFAKPVDIELVRELSERGVPILTVEDHALAGGFGSAVLEACNETGVTADAIHRLGMPMRWVYQDKRANQLAEVGLDAPGIARKVRDILNGGHTAEPAEAADSATPPSRDLEVRINKKGLARVGR